MPWAWLLNGRVIVALIVGALVLLGWFRLNAMENLAERRLVEITRLEAVIEQRDAVVREVARQAAQRQQQARDAIAAAMARTSAAEAVLRELRAARPNTGDACRNAELILQQYRERQP